MTNPVPADLDELERLMGLGLYHSSARMLDAAIRELRAHRAAGEPEPEWEPLHDADGMLNVDEGNTYLFAIELTDGWEYFQDAIVWDSETDPDWRDGGHGWALENVTHFRTRPAPPKPEPAATTGEL